MNLYRKIQSIKTQIIDTERLLEMVLDHPIMSEGLKERINLLRQELESLPKESFEPSVQLLFSGNAVIGSQGIKSTIDEEKEVFINGIFRGLLLDSGKFEILDEEGKEILRFISEELIEEEQLIDFNKTFLNQNCVIYLRVHRKKFNTGNEKIDYELLELKGSKN